MGTILVILFVVILSVNCCEKEFFTYNGIDCVRVINAKATYKMAEIVCKAYKNSTIGTFKEEDKEFFKILSFNVLNVKNSVWVNKELNAGEDGLCPTLVEDEEAIKYVNCEAKHSFICSHKKEESMTEKFDKFRENIEKQILNLSNQIDKVNETMYSSVASVLSNTANIEFDRSAENAIINSSVLQRFFYISEKIDKCAVPVSIAKSSENTTLYFNETDNITLQCEPRGNPIPKVYWTAPNSNIISNTSKLIIQNAHRFQSGVYSCIVDNAVGKAKVEEFDVQIEHKPLVSISETEIFTGTGQRVTMTCSVLSNPKPTIRWTKHGSQSELNDGFMSIQTILSRNNTYFESRLTTDIQSSADLGIYECQASNRIGVDSGIVDVKGSAPFNGSITRVEQVDYKTYIVHTNFKSYSKILNYKLLMKQKPSSFIWYLPMEPSIKRRFNANTYIESFRLDSLNKNTEYNIKITADNEFGTGNVTDEYTFRTTYTCGENAVSMNEWRYMVSHNSYAVQSFDNDYMCSSRITSDEGNDIEIKFIEFSVNKKSTGERRRYYDILDTEARVKVYDENNGRSTQITSNSQTVTGKKLLVTVESAKNSNNAKSTGFVLKFKSVRKDSAINPTTGGMRYITHPTIESIWLNQ